MVEKEKKDSSKEETRTPEEVKPHDEALKRKRDERVVRLREAVEASFGDVELEGSVLEIADREKNDKEKDQVSLPEELAERINSGKFITPELAEIDPSLHSQIAEKLIQTGQAWKICRGIDEFQDIDHAIIADKIAEVGGFEFEELRKNIKKFQKLNKPIADRLIEEGKAVDFFGLMHRNIFQGLDQSIAEKLIKAGHSSVVVGNINRFQNIDYADMANKLIEAGSVGGICFHLNKYPGVDQSMIANKAIEEGSLHTFASNIKKFWGLDGSIVDKLIEANELKVVAQNIERFSGVDSESIAKKIIELGKGYIIGRNIDKFQIKDKSLAQEALRSCMEKGDLKSAVDVNKKFGGKIDKAFNRAFKDLGQNLDGYQYSFYVELEKGSIPKELQEIGISAAGSEGMDQLRKKMKDFVGDMVNEVNDPDLLKSKIFQSFLKSSVRYSSSGWGNRSDSSFINTIDNYLDVKDDIRPLDPALTPSEVLAVDKIDRQKTKEFKHSPDFLKRYSTMLHSLKEAKRSLEDENALDRILDTIRFRRDELVQLLGDDIAKRQDQEYLETLDERRRAAVPKSIAGLTKKMQGLEKLNLEEISDPQQIFQELSSHKVFDEELRQLVFYFSFLFNPGQKEKNLDEFDPEEPTIDQLSWVIDHIDHVTNRESFRKYFTDTQAAKRFNSLTNVSILEQELTRWQNQKAGGKKMPMRFVPCRNLLTEFSGHIADACWASKYKSIIEKFPNMSSMIMVQNPDTPDQRLAGAAMLIETTSADSEKLLVIRGLNPIENTINQLVVEDFMTTMTDYLRARAEVMGRKLAIVIDLAIDIDEEGGSSGTNRPVIQNYLENIDPNLEKVNLDSADDTTFNEYNIVDRCYFV